jgi:hypothetical protein
MMHMNKTGIACPAGRSVTAFAPGTLSFGATLSGRFPAAI